MKTFKTFAVAAFVAASASMASAAAAPMTPIPDGAANRVIKVHGDHGVCARDRRGWHRHNRFGERRPCREWRGRGKRPDTCVRVGPLWYCDY